MPTPEQTARQAELQRRIRETQAKLSALSKDADAAAKKSLDDELKQLRDDEAKLLATIPTTMVMQDQPQPRDTFILERGQYDQPREKVVAGVPPFVPYALRHCKATELRDAIGIESAQATLGHAQPSMTARYSSKMDKLASEAAKVCG